VSIVLDVALHAGRTETCSAADTAERLGLARRGIEPVLQALTRAGLLESVRGPAGGYRLGRPRRDLSLAEIVRVAADGETGEEADQARGKLQAAVVLPLWEELDDLVRTHLTGLTIDDLLKRAAAKGIKPRPGEPLNFAI
jgi:Rrf2 family transcriptional regulator, iron-sulfur cluster assembly transcription factor